MKSLRSVIADNSRRWKSAAEGLWKSYSKDVEHTLIGVGIAFILVMILAPWARHNERVDFTLSFFSQLAAGGILLFIGVPFARRHIMSEHWFNRKSEAYSDIIRQLTMIERWARAVDELQGQNPAEADASIVARLESEAKGAGAKLREYQDDSFLLPEQAIEHLKAYQEALDLAMEYRASSMYWGGTYADVVASCIHAMKQTAQDELHVRQHLHGFVASPIRAISQEIREEAQRAADRAAQQTRDLEVSKPELFAEGGALHGIYDASGRPS